MMLEHHMTQHHTTAGSPISAKRGRPPVPDSGRFIGNGDGPGPRAGPKKTGRRMLPVCPLRSGKPGKGRPGAPGTAAAVCAHAAADNPRPGHAAAARQSA